MFFKVTLIAALCIVQGFAFKPRDGIPGKPPCKNPGSEIEKEIPQDFEDAIQEMDEVRETVSMAAVEAYFNGNDAEVIIACFREQKGNFSRLGQRINGKLREGNREIAELLGDNYEKYGKRIEGPLKTIGMTMKAYPVRMWLLIKEKQFSKAWEVMKESKKTIDDNSRILAEIFKEMAEEFPECAQRAEEIGQEIREEARSGCRAIGEAFRKCVEEGGPEKPVEDAEVDEDVNGEVEESVDQ